jgi:hypothetical protein
MTVPEFAERLKISRAQAYKIVAAKLVERTYVGKEIRITEAAYVKYVRGATRPADLPTLTKRVKAA